MSYATLLRTAAIAASAAALVACAGPSELQRVIDERSLPPSVELADTPFFPQSDYQCGPAALATILGAAGIPAAPAALVDEIYLPARRGSLQPEIVAALRTRGLLPYPVRASLDDVLMQVAAGRPVLVLQRLGLGPWPAWHYAVVAGYDGTADRLLLRSGTDARQQLSSGMFLATWDRAERWGLVALPAGELPSNPDYARYIEAAAGFEATGQLVPARAAYTVAARRWPEEPLPRLGLGNLAAGSGDWLEAERGFRAALTVDPDNVAARNNHAEALRQLGCLAAATAAIAQARDRAPAGHPLHAALAATAAEITSARELTREEPPVCAGLADESPPSLP